MSSEDVIELGSSDDEAAPAPKKRKPIPNAMVHIPERKQFISSQNRAVSKFSPIMQHGANKKFQIVRVSSSNINHSISNKIGPLKVSKDLQINPIKMNKNNMNLKNKMPIKVLPTTLQKLPPGITVTKTGASIQNIQNTLTKRTLTHTSMPAQKKPKVMPHVQKVILPNKRPKNNLINIAPITVELDDEEESPNMPSHNWYLKPEQQKICNSKTTPVKKSNTEDPLTLIEKNNTEPLKTFVEITIEDSPVKPNKKQSEVGKELPITIEDSPSKFIEHKNNKRGPKVNTSDEEKSFKTKQVPSSKKKLSYPENVMIEINIDGIQMNNDTESHSGIENKRDCTTPTKEKENEVASIDNEVITLEDTPQKTEEENFVFKKITLPVLAKTVENSAVAAKTIEQPSNPIAGEIISNVENNKKEYTSLDIHPEYKKFIDLCFELENSDDMKKIVEKKILGYYRQVPKEYTESEGFIEIVSSKMAAMKACPDNMYLHIKDVVDELNMQRKIAKAQLEMKENENESASSVVVEDGDPKRINQIRKLEKTLKKLHRAIQRLEEQEVDFDDEADSVYLLTDRYKERLMKVHKKLCQLTNTKLPSEPRVHIESRSGRPLGPARRLEKWINKKVPVGTPLPFPDFHDVVRCVKEANEEDKLHWNDFEVMEEARDLFVRCGKKLKRRRQENEWRLASSRIATDKDPAEESLDLKKKLEENKTAADRKESDVINKYADRQYQLKLEAVEITEKEADESPAESDDEVQEIPITTDKSNENTSSEKSLEKETPESQEESEDEIQEIPITNNRLDDSTSQGKSTEENKSDLELNDENSLKSDNKKNDANDKDNEVKVNQKEYNENEENKNKEKTEFNITINSLCKDQHLEGKNNINEISDDEGDELNLLEEINLDLDIKSSSLESLSESDDNSAIAISDSVESAEETHEKSIAASDVESIVLSSSDEDSLNISNDTVKTVIEKNMTKQTMNNKNVESGESNGFTEDDSVDDNNTSNVNSPNCVNLRDDSITIDETIITPNKEDSSNTAKTINTIVLNKLDSSNSSKSVNLAEDSITFDETIIAPSNADKNKNVESGESNGSNEDDSVDDNNTSNVNSPNCVNLRDDSITIDETIITPNKEDSSNTNKTINTIVLKKLDSSNSSKSVNLAEDSITFDETIIAPNNADENKNVESGESNESNEDDSVDDNKPSNVNSPNCVNLRDDSITIDETIITPNKEDSSNAAKTINTTVLNKLDSSNSSKSVNLAEDSITLDETIIAPIKADSSKNKNDEVVILKDIETAIDDLDTCNTVDKSSIVDSAILLGNDLPEVNHNKTVKTAEEFEKCANSNKEINIGIKEMSVDSDIKSHKIDAVDKIIDDSFKMIVDSNESVVVSDDMIVDSDKKKVDNNIIQTTVDHDVIKNNSNEDISDMHDCRKHEENNTTGTINNDSGDFDINNIKNKIILDTSSDKTAVDNIENIKIDTNKVAKPSSIPNNEKMEI